MTTILPWQTTQMQTFFAYQKAHRLPHALLLVGKEGLGKKQFAMTLAHFLLCQEKKLESSCGECHACHLLRAASHPDLLQIEPEQSGSRIKIDQIRAMVESVHETALQGGLHVVMIDPAHAMNHHAANALLKTLEEPPPHTMIILISEQSARLPATITSRCQKIMFQKPTTEMALSWLQPRVSQEVDLSLLLNLAEGAPLKALAFIESDFLALRQIFYEGLHGLMQCQIDPIQLAAQLHEKDMLTVLHLFFVWMQDMLRYLLTHDETVLINQDYQNSFHGMTRQISCELLLNYLDHVKKIYAYFLDHHHLNRQLTLEALFIGYVDLIQGKEGVYAFS